MILRSSRWGCEILRNTLQEGDDTENLVIREWSVDGRKGLPELDVEFWGWLLSSPDCLRRQPRRRPPPTQTTQPPRLMRASTKHPRPRCDPKTKTWSSLSLQKQKNPLLNRGFPWSGRRDSNPRPSPWQGDALPAELRPRQSETIAVMGQFDASGVTRRSTVAGLSAA